MAAHRQHVTRRSRASDGRALHPGAWWLWAAAMATAAVRTTNPIVLALIAAVVCYVVAVRRTAEVWSRSLVFFLRVGLVVIALRVVLQVVFGDRIAGHVLFSLPRVPLPSWAAGVSIGGPVTAELVLQSFCEGLRLAVMLLAFGAANSLASPYRLLRCLPAVLYEAGVAVTVALAYAPELVVSIGNVRAARRLRGRPTRGLAGLRGMAVPVLEGALDRSLELASSMDARGYGRRVAVTSAMRQGSNVATWVGLLLVLAGVFDTLSPALPWGIGLFAIVDGVGLLSVGMVLSGLRTRRSRYRPDEWRTAEWLVTASGLAVVAALSVSAAVHVEGLQVSFYPLAVPMVPVLPCVGVLLGLLPALAAPARTPARVPAGRRVAARPTSSDDAAVGSA
jgi:energy-coupling factor transport system permease protein